MAIERDTVLHVARLARLHLTEEELPQMCADLGKILEHVAQLDELDTESVEPTAQGAVVAAPLRVDAGRRTLDREELLSEAPRHNGDGFAVPAFVEEG